MATIPLTRGMVALVDESDYAALAAHKWYAMANPTRFYAVRNVRRPDGSRTLLMMHAEIMGSAPAPRLTVDHREPTATLDNRRHNLRWATKSQQRQNTGRRSTRAGYKGVVFSRRYRNWQAQITPPKGKLTYLGSFADPKDAARAYDVAALRLFGEFAHLNFPAESNILAEPQGSTSI